MTVSAEYQTQAKAETTKRLLAQLVNEELVTLHLFLCAASQRLKGRIADAGDITRWIEVSLASDINAAPVQRLWRPDDFEVPVVLNHVDIKELQEDDPGAIFQFIAPRFDCDEGTKDAIALELSNSAAMLEEWLGMADTQPMPSLKSSFLEWERSIIKGHPTHPFHRTCFADKLLQPVRPHVLPEMLNPGLTFVMLPRSSVRVFGPFEELSQPLLRLLEAPSSVSEDTIIVPCLSQQLPAVLEFFPEAKALKTVPNCAKAHAAIRTVSIPGYKFDMKFSLACLITSALRALPCWSAAAAPHTTDILKTLLPEDIWVFGEVAAVTGSQDNASEARHLTCILRESLEDKAQENDETLILASALMEKPLGGQQTHAELLFDLTTTESKVSWFTGYIRLLLRLALDPLRNHGVGCEFHGQNTVVRICYKTKSIKGFAIRDLAGVKLHRSTLKEQGFDLSSVGGICTDDIHEVWDRVHHALLQNNIGYMLYALGLEKASNGWALVRSVLSDILESDSDPVGKNIYQYFVQEMMPFKCFIRMRMGASLKSRMGLIERNLPNVLAKKSPWLSQISLAGTKDPERPALPVQIDSETRVLERETMQTHLFNSTTPYGQLPDASRGLNPHPALLPKQFLEDLETFQEALATALDNIIERWWKDKEAKLPSRMPLEPQAEALLQWVDRATDDGVMLPFKGHQGNLRPDILVPVTGSETPEFRVCEINARFPINLLHFHASAYEALASCAQHTPFEPATKHTALFDGLLELFDKKSVHFVREKAGIPSNSPLFGFLEKRTGARPRIVSPSSLRLVPDATRRTGFILCCVWGADPEVKAPPSQLMNVNGELLEEVQQVGLQLFDYELFSLPTEMVRHIALCCTNDIRSVFIAHDKRILGIILQELDTLVKRQALSPSQAQTLRKGIIPTILPGSKELKDILNCARDNPQTKDGFILKPVREARGSGIVLGKDLSVDQWESIITSLEHPSFEASEMQYMLQPLLQPQSFDWFWDEERKVQKSRMVGTYYSVNGRFKGLGMWRTAKESENVISASTKDVMVVFSVTCS